VSKWAGKYIIGLTGNIGTGKSVVRRMLEHLGAYGIDADQLSHRAIAKGAPAYQPVVEMFGRWILGEDGQIDRSRLGKVVFSDPAALAHLERIVHPFVEQAVDIIIRRAPQPVVVIEAIKLLESNVHKMCDAVWVVNVPPEAQLARLIQNRHMSEAEARQRITAQPPAADKIAKANLVIGNGGSFEDTWKQVVAGWQKMVPVAEAPAPPKPEAAAPAHQLSVMRGKPRQAAEIAALFNRLRKNPKPLTADDIMASFGEKAFMLLQLDATLVGAIGWQVENLVSRTTDLVLDPQIAPEKALPELVKEMERASRELQCEASLVFLPRDWFNQDPVWRSLGYAPRTPQSLVVLAWQEAAIESMPHGTILYFKQLRTDRILRPI
jgi:dephospho-CoA kinase